MLIVQSAFSRESAASPKQRRHHTKRHRGGDAARRALIQDCLQEDGAADGDLPHLYLDRTLIARQGHAALTPDALEQLLLYAQRRRTPGHAALDALEQLLLHGQQRRMPVKKLTLEFNHSEALGLGDYVAANRDLEELSVLCEELSVLREELSVLCETMTDGTLEELAQALTNMTDGTLEELAQALTVSRVTTFRLVAPEITGPKPALQLGAMVAMSQSLRELVLFGCRLGDDGAVEIGRGLATNGMLTALDIAHCGVGDVGCVALAEGMLAARAPRCALRQLNLRHNTIGATGAEALATFLEYQGCSHAASGGDGVQPGALLGLNLGTNPIGDEGAAALAAALRVNGALLSLTLYGCGIGAAGALALAAALADNSALAELKLRGNKGIGARECARLREAFGQRTISGSSEQAAGGAQLKWSRGEATAAGTLRGNKGIGARECARLREAFGQRTISGSSEQAAGNSWNDGLQLPVEVR
ncbi:hypothetical protein JKP88DRAFT_280323 [Tribonema minus]|uniref:Uncharacterized protein n=1 Tax=Tribonema minus TaxID=303371 RepID=A0A835YRN5_9STRA|nr:hypothetical protein JKP88DRAFT_280323 [Tribonema minus]